MKILCLTGTRPEIIRLSCIIKKLEKYADSGLIEFIHCYSNQNYDPNLSTIFFQQLKLKHLPIIFNVNNSVEFIDSGKKLFKVILEEQHPDKVLILGDTYSCLLAEEAVKMNIPVYHMEAGSRCYDDSLPEERNRKIIDKFSTYNLPYSENAKNILLHEGFKMDKIIKTGNPIKEVLYDNEFSIGNSEILTKYNLLQWQYVLLTMHRSNIVDNAKEVYNVIRAVNKIAEKMPVIFPMHPRTKNQLIKHELTFSKNVIITEPLGLFEFVKLEKGARIVITDSGTVPEECAIFSVPCISIRNTTERHELLETGSMILAGTDPENILRAYQSIYFKKEFNIPMDYNVMNVSDIVVKILIGK